MGERHEPGDRGLSVTGGSIRCEAYRDGVCIPEHGGQLGDAGERPTRY